MRILKSLAYLILLIPTTAFSYAYVDIDTVVDMDNGAYPFADASYWDSPEIYGDSRVNWLSGSQAYSRFDLYGTSEFDFLGGSLDGIVQAHNDAIASLNGGTIEFSILTRDSSTLNINSGTIRFASSLDSSEIIFSGGVIEVAIALKENSTLTVVGDNLNYSYTGRNDTFGYDSYLLTGLFQTGEDINTEIRLYDGFIGLINFSDTTNISEPAILPLFFLLFILMLYMVKGGAAFSFIHTKSPVAPCDIQYS
ncbi:hypothetical protein [Sedimenticola sp.]|uniref:hypothetical protein n=1 Tax=Sedimenticola sp. TaxID=1940285 RepID=UPI003D135AC2